MTLKKQSNSSSESSSGSSSGSSSSSSSSSSSGSGSSSSESDSSSESPKPREEPPPPPPPPAAPPASSLRPPQDKALNNKARGPPPRRRSSTLSKSKVAVAAGSRHARTPGRTGTTRPAARTVANKTTPPAADKSEPKKPLKKKSIFSPDNSTESESELNNVPKTTNKTAPKPSPKPSPPVLNNKQKGKRPKTSTSSNDKVKTENPPPETKPKENETTNTRQKKPSLPKKSPPVKKKSEKEANSKYPSKETVSSCTSTNTESTASASSSDSDSSAPSVKTPAPKRAAVVAAKLGRSAPLKVEPVKTEKNTPTKDAPVPPCTDSDVENTKPANNTANITRKLTRSASARKSRHVVGKAANSDTESETELGPTKRSVSKSPIKRATNSSKGPAPLSCPVKGRTSSLIGTLPGLGTGAIPRGGQPTVPSSPRSSVPEKEQELHCMLPGCDSLGHLSGRMDRHFTIEACPTYHNLTAEECSKSAIGTRALQETRRRAQHALAARRTSQPSLEHRAYQLKIKELRAKSKVSTATTTTTTTTVTTTTTTTNSTDCVKQEKVDNTTTTCKTVWSAQQEAEIAGEREPVLTGFVPDYDLSLFREAQAAAAYKIEEELKNMPPSKGTRYVCMGKYRMEAWYQSPYPPDAARLPQLYLCEFCLNHHKTVTGITRHRAKCVWRHPPGDEVYRKGRLGVWQVDGRRHKQYCQQLCLLAKFFLDHKTLYYDVEPFLFYVMTLADAEGCHTVGYFSKEKNSLQNYNVSCILTLPPYQRQGYGRLLIDFSYLLTRVEGKIGSPEKPLSDLGLISYRSYWKDVLLQYLCDHPGSTLSIRDLSQEMAINSYDIVSTLQALGMMKYWKGKHIILKRQDVLDEYIERTKRRGQVKQIDRACLKWTPFVPPSSQGGG